MRNHKNNTAKLLTLAIAITLLSGLPVLAQKAHVEQVGEGSGLGDVIPELMSSRPFLGKSVTLAAGKLTSDGAAWFFFSPVADGPTALGKDVMAYVNLDQYIAVGPYAVDGDGFLVVSTTLPYIPQLEGVRVAIQVASAPADDRLEVTNGLIWTLGY